MNQTLEQLKGCPDIPALRRALQSVCSRFGSLQRLDILSGGQRGKRQVMCFLRMDSAEEERRLALELGIGRFGGDLVVVVELPVRCAANDVGAVVMAA